MTSPEFIYAVGIVEIECFGMLFAPSEAFLSGKRWPTCGPWNDRYPYLQRIMHPIARSLH
jgi:hypothetical protein